jgi:hypothetical protein
LIESGKRRFNAVFEVYLGRPNPSHPPWQVGQALFLWPKGINPATAGTVTETKLVRLIARVKYKAKERKRRAAVVYDIGLVP